MHFLSKFRVQKLTTDELQGARKARTQDSLVGATPLIQVQRPLLRVLPA